MSSNPVSSACSYPPTMSANDESASLPVCEQLHVSSTVHSLDSSSSSLSLSSSASCSQSDVQQTPSNCVSIATRGRPRQGLPLPCTKHIPHREKPPQLVARRNARERRRVQAVNSAFLNLRKSIPIENRNKRVSKVKTLQKAIEYIAALQQLLKEVDETKIPLKSQSIVNTCVQPLNSTPVRNNTIPQTSCAGNQFQTMTTPQTNNIPMVTYATSNATTSVYNSSSSSSVCSSLSSSILEEDEIHLISPQTQPSHMHPTNTSHHTTNHSHNLLPIQSINTCAPVASSSSHMPMHTAQPLLSTYPMYDVRTSVSNPLTCNHITNHNVNHIQINYEANQSNQLNQINTVACNAIDPMSAYQHQSASPDLPDPDVYDTILGASLNSSPYPPLTSNVTSSASSQTSYTSLYHHA